MSRRGVSRLVLLQQPPRLRSCLGLGSLLLGLRRLWGVAVAGGLGVEVVVVVRIGVRGDSFRGGDAGLQQVQCRAWVQVARIGNGIPLDSVSAS